MADIQGSLFGEAFKEPEVPRDPAEVEAELRIANLEIGERVKASVQARGKIVEYEDNSSEARQDQGHGPQAAA